jgi:hypothetical protein
MASNHGSVVYWMTGPVRVPHRRPSTCLESCLVQENWILDSRASALSMPSPGGCEVDVASLPIRVGPVNRLLTSAYTPFAQVSRGPGEAMFSPIFRRPRLVSACPSTTRELRAYRST